MTAKTLLLGNNQITGWIAEKLLEDGNELMIASPRPQFEFSPESDAVIQSHEPATTLLAGATVAGCHGAFGDFTLRMVQNAESFSCSAKLIVICEDIHRRPEFDVYGLRPSAFIVPLSQVTNSHKDDGGTDIVAGNSRTVVFLMGLLKESHPVIARDIMESALRFQQKGKQVYILTGNLKVAANGLETCYRETRKAGVVYVKFTETRPEIKQTADLGVRIEFQDEILNQRVRLSPDLTIVDEALEPSDYLKHLIHIFELDADLNGFAQADNVHRLSVLSNRRGILVAGQSRNIFSTQDQWTDAANTVLSSAVLKQFLAKGALSYAEIDPGNCVRCLTCHRLCPYRAISVNARVHIQPEACESCGICIAECPRGAIHIKGPALSDVQQAVDRIGEVSRQTPFTPSIAAFCCSRSAVQAGKLAACMGYEMPKGLKTIEVPCAGSVSIHHLLAGFQNGADGVLVLTCHKGNCHSEKGNLLAGQRVDHLKNVIENMGMEADRLRVKTLASNMGAEFAQLVGAFEKGLLELGPSKLKPQD